WRRSRRWGRTPVPSPDAEAEYNAIPIVCIVELAQTVNPRLGRDSTSPEGQRAEIPPRHRHLPYPRPLGEDPARGRAADAPPTVLPHDEELGHVPVDRHSAVVVPVDQAEAGDAACDS